MTNAREAILGAVRSALAHVPGLPSPAGPPPARPTPMDTSGRKERFKAKLEGVGGVVTVVPDLAAASRHLASLVEARQWNELASSGDPLVQEALAGAQLEGFDGDSDRTRLEACDAGVTSAQYAVAETGTLVLLSHAERHRLASLLPPVHVALLPVSRLVDGLGDALAGAHASDGGAPPPLVTLITGPSRTGDIELQMVMGVHGPRELHVLLIDNA